MTQIIKPFKYLLGEKMGKAYIVKTRQQWLDQAQEGVELQKKYANIAECATLRGMLIYAKSHNYEDWKIFGKMIEAFIALGVSVSEELKKLADIKTVNEALELPDYPDNSEDSDYREEYSEEYDEPYDNEPEYGDDW